MLEQTTKVKGYYKRFTIRSSKSWMIRIGEAGSPVRGIWFSAGAAMVVHRREDLHTTLRTMKTFTKVG